MTLKFETAERVIDTRVYFNGNERTATPQVISETVTQQEPSGRRSIIYLLVITDWLESLLRF